MPIIRLDPDSPMGKRLQQQQTLYYGLISVPLILFLVLFLQTNQLAFEPLWKGEELSVLHFVVWLLVILGAIWAVKNYRKQMKAYRGPANLEQKFYYYLQETRRLYFMLIPLMFIPVIVMWLTGVIFYGALFTLLIILIASFRPTVEQFVERSNLSKAEQEELQKLA